MLFCTVFSALYQQGKTELMMMYCKHLHISHTHQLVSPRVLKVKLWNKKGFFFFFKLKKDISQRIGSTKSELDFCSTIESSCIKILTAGAVHSPAIHNKLGRRTNFLSTCFYLAWLLRLTMMAACLQALFFASFIHLHCSFIDKIFKMSDKVSKHCFNRGILTI